MEENIDIKQTLQNTNQELLLNKKKMDLDKAMESLYMFYINYSPTISNEINNRVCSYHNIDPNSEQGKIFYNTITSFFFIVSKKLDEIIKSTIEPIKSKIDGMTDEEYNKELNHTSVVIINQMKDHYIENVNMLSSELNQNVDEETKSKIDKYLLEILTVKMINILKDKLMYAIRVVNNNFEENYHIIDTINENTVNKV